MFTDRRLKLERLCQKLFGTCKPYCCLRLGDNDNPQIVLHDGRKDLQIAIYKNNKWRVIK